MSRTFVSPYERGKKFTLKILLSEKYIHRGHRVRHEILRSRKCPRKEKLNFEFCSKLRKGFYCGAFSRENVCRHAYTELVISRATFKY